MFQGKKVRNRAERQKVICGHCGAEMMKSYLDHHTHQRHYGMPSLVKGEVSVKAFFPTLAPLKRPSEEKVSKEEVSEKLRKLLPPIVPVEEAVKEDADSEQQELKILGEIRNCKTGSECMEKIQSISHYQPMLQTLLSSRPEIVRDGIKMDKNCDRLLRPEWNCKSATVKGDGNCLYSAISIGLTGTPKYSNILRLAELELMIQKKKNLNADIGGRTAMSEFGITYDSLFKETSTIGAWATEANILFASQIIRRPIHVVSYWPSGDLETVSRYNAIPAVLGRTPLQIMVYGEYAGRHFQPLLPFTWEQKPIAPQGDQYTQIDENLRLRVEKDGKAVLPNLNQIYNLDSQEQDDGKNGQNPSVAVPEKQCSELEPEKETKRIPIFVKSLVRQMREVERSKSEPTTSSDYQKIIKELGHKPVITKPVFLKSLLRSMKVSDPVDSFENSLGVSHEEGTQSNVAVETEDISRLVSAMEKLQVIESAGRMEIIAKIDALSENLSNLKLQPLPVSKTQVSSKTKVSDAMSIAQILQQFPELRLRLDEEVANDGQEFTSLVCDLCYEGEKGTHHGEFQYSSLDGIDFRGRKLPRRFINLRRNINNHMSSAKHMTEADKMEQSKTEKRSNLVLSKKAGLVCGTLAYKAIKLDANACRYELDVTLAQSMGLSVGDINHSRKFCSEFRESIYKVLYAKTKSVMNTPLRGTKQPPPVCIFADKYTPNRETGQVVGLATILGGKLNTLLTGFTKPGDHSADGLAADLLEPVVGLLGPDYTKRLVSAAFDGEYFVKKVNEALIAHMEVDPQASQWYTIQWDEAHRLERSVKEGLGIRSLNSTTVSWFHTEIHATINTIHDHYGYGQRYAALRTHEESRVPLMIQTHRFTSYSHRALNNFVANYPTIYELLSLDQDDDINKINSAPFVLGMCFSADLYKLLGDVSLVSQKVETLPWRQREAINGLVSTLNDLKTSIGRGAGLPDVFTNYSQALTELKNSYTYKGRPVLVAREQRYPTRGKPDNREAVNRGIDGAEETVREHGADLVGKIAADLITRGSAFACDTVQDLIRLSFAIENVCKHAKDESVPEEFLKYAALSMQAGFMEEVSTEDLSTEYHNFSGVVQKEMENYKGKKVHEFEYSLYCRLIDSDSKIKMHNALHLLASAMVRSANEAPAESMGNILKFHSRNIDLADLGQEAFIHWNGPSPVLAKKLVTDGLNVHFKGSNWHFVRASSKNKLINWAVSAVVDRKKKEETAKSRILYD